MMTKLLQTDDEKALAAARVLLGVLVFIRGAQGLLGWFGGSGIYDLGSFLRVVSPSAPLVLLVVLVNFLGGIGLITGLFTRIAAACILADTASTVVLWAVSPRVFLDWSITQGGASIEYYSLAFAIALTLVVRGAGAFSFDRMLLGRRFRRAGLRTVSAHAGPPQYKAYWAAGRKPKAAPSGSGAEASRGL
jgi:putative oxidoreductase